MTLSRYDHNNTNNNNATTNNTNNNNENMNDNYEHKLLLQQQLLQQQQEQQHQQQSSQQQQQQQRVVLKPLKEKLDPVVMQKASRYAVRVFEEMSKRSKLLRDVSSRKLNSSPTRSTGTSNNSYNNSNNSQSSRKSFNNNNNNNNQNNNNNTTGLVVAKFDRDEVLPYLGEMLGKGGFNNVYELEKIKLLRNFDEVDNDTLRKNIVLTKPKLAVKFLSDEALLNPEDACNGSADLLMESKYLTALASHPHPALIKLHGISSSGPAGFSYPDRAGFFLIIDRLYDTLDRRIDVWREIQRRKLNHKAITGIAPPSTIEIESTTKYLKVLFIQRLITGYEIASALRHLHSLHIIFRDLKPDNVGFDYEGRVKIFDFGLAKELDPKQQLSEKNGLYNMSGGTGSRRFMAPEVSLSEPYGLSADMFSFSILLWELLTLEKAFGRMPVDEHRERVILGNDRPPINHNEWNRDVIYLLEQCWQRDPLSRPSSLDVQNDMKSIIRNLVQKDFPSTKQKDSHRSERKQSTGGSSYRSNQQHHNNINSNSNNSNHNQHQQQQHPHTNNNSIRSRRSQPKNTSGRSRDK